MAQVAEKVSAEERGSITTSSYSNKKGAERVSVQMDKADARAVAKGDKAVLDVIIRQVRMLLAS